MLKKIILTAFSLILAYNTVKLTAVFFKLNPEDFSRFASIVSAFAFNLMITGSVAFLGFAYPTNKLLPDSYYQIKQPKTLNSIYKWLGVEYFRILLLKTFYRKDDNKKYFTGTKSGILLFDYNTKQSEFGHLIAFLLLILFSIILFFEGHKSVFVWILPINIVLNFYPIILQRKHRIIIQRMIKRM